MRFASSMIHRRAPGNSRRRLSAGWTLMELMVAVAVLVVVLAVVGSMLIYMLKSFAALGNYVSLDRNSRNALDRMSKQMRQAYEVIDFKKSGNDYWIKFVGTNDANATVVTTFQWIPAARALTEQTDSGPVITNLTGCDQWQFKFFTRSPVQNKSAPFVETTQPKDIKLVSMTWKCSRSLLGKDSWNTESVQTAQIVLRNKQKD